MLHVPHMATSWEEQSDRWVPFDESWRGLFAAGQAADARARTFWLPVRYVEDERNRYRK